MYLDDVALRVVEKDLVPFGGEGGAVIGKGNAVITEMLLEPLDVVRAKGDMAAFNRVDMSAVSRRHVQIPFGKMHLHAALRGEFDLTVVACVAALATVARAVAIATVVALLAALATVVARVDALATVVACAAVLATV